MSTDVINPENAQSFGASLTAVKEEFGRRFRKLSSRAKWGGLAAVVLVAPLTYFLAYLMFGAALMGIAGTVLALVWLVIVNKLPAWSARLANHKLRELKAEAERSPVETLQIGQQKVEAEFRQRAEELTKLDVGVEEYRQFLMNTSHEHPEAAAEGIPTLRQYEQLLVYRRRKIRALKAAKEERQRKIELFAAKYAVALKGRELSATAGDGESKVLDKILEDIAFSAIDSACALNMAQMRTALELEAVPEDEAPVLAAPSSADATDRQQLRLALQQGWTDADLRVQNVVDAIPVVVRAQPLHQVRG